MAEGLDHSDHLAQLREELDQLDRQMLQCATRRTEIVSEIGKAKAAMGAGRPLFDRDRERAVYDRARQVADEIGLSPKVAHQIMQVLVESSHQIQEQASQQSALEAPAEERKRFVIVGGGGRMGRLLGAAFQRRGHEIDVLEVNDGRDRAEALSKADITMIAVPMESAANVVAELAPYVPAHALLCDINSLKQDVCEAMQAHGRSESLGLHPMFGPTVHSLRRQKVVVCPVNAGSIAQWLQTELGLMGLELIESTPVAHDRMMAVVQVLVHYSTIVMGEALRSTGVSVEESLRFTSPIYRLELAFVGRLFAQNPDLYAEIEMSNPHAAEVRRCFLDAAERVGASLARGDRDAFRALFGEVTNYFHGFSDEAMQLSDFIIDAMVMQP